MRVVLFVLVTTSLFYAVLFSLIIDTEMTFLSKVCQQRIFSSACTAQFSAWLAGDSLFSDQFLATAVSVCKYCLLSRNGDVVSSPRMSAIFSSYPSTSARISINLVMQCNVHATNTTITIDTITIAIIIIIITNRFVAM